MFDVLNSLQDLARFDVVLTGDWAVSTQGHREWSGEANAETVIVGIIFLRCGNQIYWAKSGTPYAKVAHFIESQPLSGKLFMELRLQCTLNVQFMYSLGLRDSIYQASALLSSEDYLPPIPPSRTVQTGQLFTFASFDSSPSATLYTMFLAKQDVKMKRNHIWGLRKALLSHLTSPLLEVFAVGRTGEFEV
jgi:hypothetical protein